jgi:hypothetical protein
MALDQRVERGLVAGQHAGKDFAVLFDADRPLTISGIDVEKVAVEQGKAFAPFTMIDDVQRDRD